MATDGKDKKAGQGASPKIPKEKIKVSRARTRLYETPAPLPKDTLEEPSASQTSSAGSGPSASTESAPKPPLGADRPPAADRPLEAPRPEATQLAPAEEMIMVSKEELALEVVKKYVIISLGAGTIPIPLVDLAAISVIQYKMIDELKQLYGMELENGTVKMFVGSLAGGVGAMTAAGGLFGVILMFPGLGILAPTLVPVLGGAATYAVGKVFVKHFETGGTFLAFDEAKVRAYYHEQFKKGREIVSGIVKKNSR